jgi:hypothetical protein
MKKTLLEFAGQSEFFVGDQIEYERSARGSGKWNLASILAVDRFEGMLVYSIRLDNGHDRQTTIGRLRSPVVFEPVCQNAKPSSATSPVFVDVGFDIDINAIGLVEMESVRVARHPVEIIPSKSVSPEDTIKSTNLLVEQIRTYEDVCHSPGNVDQNSERSALKVAFVASGVFDGAIQKNPWKLATEFVPREMEIDCVTMGNVCSRTLDGIKNLTGDPDDSATQMSNAVKTVSNYIAPAVGRPDETSSNQSAAAAIDTSFESRSPITLLKGTDMNVDGYYAQLQTPLFIEVNGDVHVDGFGAADAPTSFAALSESSAEQAQEFTEKIRVGVGVDASIDSRSSVAALVRNEMNVHGCDALCQIAMMVEENCDVHVNDFHAAYAPTTLAELSESNVDKAQELEVNINDGVGVATSIDS